MPDITLPSACTELAAGLRDRGIGVDVGTVNNAKLALWPSDITPERGWIAEVIAAKIPVLHMPQTSIDERCLSYVVMVDLNEASSCVRQIGKALRNLPNVCFMQQRKSAPQITSDSLGDGHKLSICITLKNRAAFMQGFIDGLKHQDYSLKNVELCITDGFSTDNIKEVLQENAHLFYQIKYAISDRSVLPFKIVSNNPACDINAQIINQPTFSKIIRTDAEVRFRSPDTLAIISRELIENPALCIAFNIMPVREGYEWKHGKLPAPTDHPTRRGTGKWAHSTMSFHCIAFTKEAFIANRGVDERYAIGFAAEDSYFHWWWKVNRPYRQLGLGYKCYHLYHTPPGSEANAKLREEYTLPLYEKMKKENTTPNSHLEGTEWHRPEMLKDAEVYTGYPHGLTAHMVIRNEPFVYYAVQSVYPHVDKILLYDTGSYDEHTLEDIRACLKKDTDGKITFKKVKIETDETVWTHNTVQQEAAQNEGKISVGTIRQRMIDDTRTSHFIIVDGDEVHYAAGIWAIRELVDAWPADIDCVRVPLIWYYDFNGTANLDCSVGRVFRTEYVCMNGKSPCEMHISKADGRNLEKPHKRVMDVGVEPYAHFELPLKPWRRKHKLTRAEAGGKKRELPEVIRMEPDILRRYEKEMQKVAPVRFLEELTKAASRHSSVLDMGSSSGDFLGHVKARKRLGIDACKLAIEDAERKYPKAKWVCADLKDISRYAKKNSFNCVTGIDVLEHFEKKDALKLLEDAEAIANKVVHLFVPLGCHPQDKDDKGYGNDSYETHRSYWTATELAALGYDVLHYPDYHAKRERATSAAVAWCTKDVTKRKRKGKITIQYRYPYDGEPVEIEEYPHGLTAHIMVKNEPFVYYAVMSVYDYVDRILLVDTGSDDAHTLADIERCLSEDRNSKIEYIQAPIDTDETRWVEGTQEIAAYKNHGKFGKGQVRKMMLEETRTSHFIIVDGDEVHYKNGIKKCRGFVDDWPAGKVCLRIPLLWNYDIDRDVDWTVYPGRLFLTQFVGMNTQSPGEYHTFKPTGGALTSSESIVEIVDVEAIEHFEIPLKPWRRKDKIELDRVAKRKRPLPEIMCEVPDILKRWRKEQDAPKVSKTLQGAAAS